MKKRQDRANIVRKPTNRIITRKFFQWNPHIKRNIRQGDLKTGRRGLEAEVNYDIGRTLIELQNVAIDRRIWREFFENLCPNEGCKGRKRRRNSQLEVCDIFFQFVLKWRVAVKVAGRDEKQCIRPGHLYQRCTCSQKNNCWKKLLGHPNQGVYPRHPSKPRRWPWATSNLFMLLCGGYNNVLCCIYFVATFGECLPAILPIPQLLLSVSPVLAIILPIQQLHSSASPIFSFHFTIPQLH